MVVVTWDLKYDYINYVSKIKTINLEKNKIIL